MLCEWSEPSICHIQRASSHSTPASKTPSSWLSMEKKLLSYQLTYQNFIFKMHLFNTQHSGGIDHQISLISKLSWTKEQVLGQPGYKEKSQFEKNKPNNAQPPSSEEEYNKPKGNHHAACFENCSLQPKNSFLQPEQHIINLKLPSFQYHTILKANMRHVDEYEFVIIFKFANPYRSDPM